MTNTDQPCRLLRPRQVFGRNGLIPVHVATGWAWIKRGDFPAPVVLNVGQKRSVVAFRESDVLRWMASRPEGLGRRLADAAYANRGKRARQVKAEASGAAEARPRRLLPRRVSSRVEMAEA